LLKVIQQLPENLAREVLAASPANLRYHLSILHGNLHRLAIEAAFPSIRRHQSLTLSIDSDLAGNAGIAYTVLHAAITACRALQRLHLNDIPLEDSVGLLQLISAACLSPSDVSLRQTTPSVMQYGDQEVAVLKKCRDKHLR
jgi:hypothetical protein